MIKNILNTTFSRLLVSLIGLINLFIYSNEFGSIGVGTISLVVLGLTIVAMINNIVGGSALVYLIPQKNISNLLIPSYLWAFVVSFFVPILLVKFKLVDFEFLFVLILMSLVHTISTINNNVLLAKEKIKEFNISAIIQSLMTLFSLIFILYFGLFEGVNKYLFSLFLGFFFSMAFSLISIRDYFDFNFDKFLFDDVRNIFKYGFFTQIANISQLLNYRLSYYFVEYFLGRASLGVFSLAVQLAESIWILPKSIAVVQYSRVSNEKNIDVSFSLSKLFLRFTFWSSFMLILFVMFIPDNIFTYVFSKDFSQVKSIIKYLSPGIFSISVSLIFSHFISGLGGQKQNAIASSIGLIVTAISGYIFIQYLGIIGAGISASLSYLVLSIYLLIVFIKYGKLRVNDFIIKKSDFKKVIQTLKVK